MNKKAVLEGLLFLSGSDGLEKEDILSILDVSDEQLFQLLKELQQNYECSDRGIRLEILGNCFKLVTKKEHHEYYEKLIEVQKNTSLSQASLETLAIIAYNQPVTRVKVDEIRGVSSSHIVRKLLSLSLIKELGRADTPGRPLLYGTTKEFLDHFGLATIEELPKIEEVEVEMEQTDLFQSKYVEKN